MKQSKLESVIESTANIASGFIISFSVWTFLVGPLVAADVFHPTSAHDAFLITCIFTVTSWLRSYVWRRFFNAGLHKAVHKLVAKHFTGKLHVGARVCVIANGLQGRIVNINDMVTTPYEVELTYCGGQRSRVMLFREDELQRID